MAGSAVQSTSHLPIQGDPSGQELENRDSTSERGRHQGAATPPQWKA